MSAHRPILGLMRCGSWGARLSPSALTELLDAAHDFGINMLDLADIYGDHSTNALLGQVFRLRPDLRAKFKLIAKIGIVMRNSPGNQRGVQHYDLSPAYLQKALDDTLQALHVDHVDTLMLHRFDPHLDAVSVSGWLDHLRKHGKFSDFGVSNFDAHALALFDAHQRICANQIELSLAQSRALIDGTHSATRARDAMVQAWSPLGGGSLLDVNHEVGARVQPQLQQMSQEFGLDASALLLRWVASLPSTQVVIGSTRVERLRSAVLACADTLPKDAWYALWEAARGVAVD